MPPRTRAHVALHEAGPGSYQAGGRPGVFVRPPPTATGLAPPSGSWHGGGVLVVMAGLPGVGKSAVADELGRRLGAGVLSVDPVEGAMRLAGVTPDQPTGLASYLVVEAVARHQLALGLPVVVDAVNAVEEARAQWRTLGSEAGVRCTFVEVVCSDTAVHRRRLEARRRDIPAFPEPTWEQVEAVRRAYAPWADPVLSVDSMRRLVDIVDQVLGHLRE